MKTAKKNRRGPAKPQETKPLRYSLTTAAKVLDISKRTLRALAVDQGEFTVIRDRASIGAKVGFQGKAPKIYLLVDEVEAHGTGGLEALRAFRAKQGRAK